jgi:Fe-S oxidoreductase
MKRFNALKERFEQDRMRVLEECLACGKCARRCPAVAAAMPEIDAAVIQRELCAFLEEPEENETALTRAVSCLECFGCLDVCPQGLNPMRTIQIAREVLFERGLAESPRENPKSPGSTHRQALAERLSDENRRAVLNPSSKGRARYALFPGCNAYLRPELVLTMRRVMDKIIDDWAFVPGLADCCGGRRLSDGDAAGAEASFRRLVSRAAQYKPEVLVMWCPTCLCNMETVYKGVSEPPFRAMSLFQLLAEKAGELDFAPIEERIAFHEPCKTSFTGLDMSHREVIAAIPGLELVEMPRRGRETVCCGAGLVETYPEVGAAHVAERLAEAKTTGADALIAACHSCTALFEDADGPLPVENLLEIAARSLGIEGETE